MSSSIKYKVDIGMGIDKPEPKSQVRSLKSWVPSLSPKYESKGPNPIFWTEAVTIITCLRMIPSTNPARKMDQVDNENKDMG